MKSYPSLTLPLLTPLLEPVVGDVLIPKSLFGGGNQITYVKLSDIIGVLGSDLPKGSLDPLSEFVLKSVNSKTGVIRDIAYTISDVPIAFKSLNGKISERSKNALTEMGLDDNDNVSGLYLFDLIDARGLGIKGVMEILGAVYLLEQNGAVYNEELYASHSESLNEMATSLLDKPWSSKIHENDPRVGSSVVSLRANIREYYSTSNNPSAKDNAEFIIANKKPLLNFRAVISEIEFLTTLADELSKIYIDDEILQIIQALERKPRAIKMIISRIGGDGSQPLTLEAVSKQHGVTRERVRQITGKFMKKIDQRSPVWTPVLDKVLDLVRKLSPISENDAQKHLLDARLIEHSFSFASLFKLAEVFGKEFDMDYYAKSRLVATKKSIVNASAVTTVAGRMITRWGALMVEQVKEELQKNNINIDKQLISNILEGRDDFQWLDREEGWFWLKGAKKNRVLNYVEKIMSVAGSIELTDLRDGTGRWHRVHGYRLPKKILLELCLATGKYTYSDGRLIGDAKMPDWQSVLSSGETKIVKILFDNEYAMRRADLEELAVKSGMGRSSFYVYIGYSPVIQKYATGVYGLRGAPVSAAKIEALIPPKLRKARNFRDNGWTDKGNLWVGYKVSKSTSASGVIGIPSNLTDLIKGSYSLLSETGEHIGTLAAKETYMWGFSPFFRRWGVEEGDYIVIEFDDENKQAKIITGDQELITNYQDNVFEKGSDIMQTMESIEPVGMPKSNDQKDALTEITAGVSQTNDPILPSVKENRPPENSSYPSFEMLGVADLNENRSIIISRRAKGSIWMNEKIISNGYTGFTKKGFGIREEDINSFIESLIEAIRSNGFRKSYELSPSVSLIVSSLENSKIDIRHYKTSKGYTGYMKKGIRLEKNQAQKLVEALTLIGSEHKFLT